MLTFDSSSSRVFGLRIQANLNDEMEFLGFTTLLFLDKSSGKCEDEILETGELAVDKDSCLFSQAESRMFWLTLKQKTGTLLT